MKPTSDAEAEDPGRPFGRHFSFLPADARQALRIRRYLMAAGTSLLVLLILFVSAGFGVVPLATAVDVSGAVFALIVLFYACLRSGLNLRFDDPSLTTEMIGASLLVLGYAMYNAPQSRGVLTLLYLVTLMFGVFRLSTARLLALAVLALAVHSMVVWLSMREDAAFDLKAGLAQLVVLAIVLPWFAVMGGYVNRLRSRLSDTHRTLTAAVTRIEHLAIRDVLTAVFNRRYLMDALEREHSRAERTGARLCVCMLDLDHFKAVNDTYGHQAGDIVLAHFARLAGFGLRAADVFGRYGGEEFLLVLPDTGAEGAVAAAERIRMRLEQSVCPVVPPGHAITVTVGVACLAAGESAATLVDRADKALYVGKKAGRNRVVVG